MRAPTTPRPVLPTPRPPRRRRPTRERNHSPERTCVGCRRKADVEHLVRLFRASDGSIVLGAGNGRGAWLCAPPAGLACLDLARTRRALDGALRAEIPGSHLDDLRARLER